MMRADDMKRAAGVQRKSWVQPSLEYVGHVGEILQGGGGKLTPAGGDPGDTRKPKGQG